MIFQRIAGKSGPKTVLNQAIYTILYRLQISLIETVVNGDFLYLNPVKSILNVVDVQNMHFSWGRQDNMCMTPLWQY